MLHSSLRESLESKNYSNIRNKLVILRKESNLTQRGLAEKLSVNQSYVSKVELGQRRLDILELRKYLKALNYPINQFLSEVKLNN